MRVPMLRSHQLNVSFVLVAVGAIPASASAQPAPAVEVRGTQLELGLSGDYPLASQRYDRGVHLGGGLTARFALTRGRFVFDATLYGGFLTVDEQYYQGDAAWIADAVIVRLRAMLGARYALMVAEHAQLHVRVAAGLESRIARYDELHDSRPNQPGQRDLSWAPVLEPAVGLRLGGAHRFVLLQVAAPMAFHRREPVRAHGSSGNTLALDLSASVLVCFTL